MVTDRAHSLHEKAVLKLLRLKGRLGMSRQVFTDIYRFNLWGNPESRSGPGSSLQSTESVRKELPLILRQFGVRTMLDAGCGDCNWISSMDLDLERYIGAEIVPALVEVNRRKEWVNAPYRREFILLDISRGPVPEVDLVFCRHCLIHLPITDILRCLDNVRRSGSKYFMATTIPSCSGNRDILTGGFRELNLQLEPFLLPEPLARINDVVVIDGEYRTDGWLYLWRLSDFPATVHGYLESARAG